MPTVADCLRQHAPAYLAKFGEAVPLGHRKVLDAIMRCRTGELGGVRYQCKKCQRKHWVGRSCGNRHCPTCGKDKTDDWLAKMSSRLLPVQHFLVTVTVPDQIAPQTRNSVLRAHQSVGYRLLFDVGAATIQDVGSATRALRDCQLGFFGVLHTWGRDPMVYHPHVHFVVPGGGVKLDDAGQAVSWQAASKDFLMHHGTAIRVYKAKLADALRECGLYDRVPAKAWKKKFVVDIEPVGDGRAVLKYLAPYVNRVAISNNRIVTCDEHSVTYRYTPSGTNASLTRRVTGEQFVRGFVQHALPRGFQKIRHYGWMHPAHRTKIEEVKWLVWLFLGWAYWLGSGYAPQEKIERREPVRCPACGGSMRKLGMVHWNCRVLVEHSRQYLDSG